MKTDAFQDPLKWSIMYLGQKRPLQKLSPDQTLLHVSDAPVPCRDQYQVASKGKKIPGPVALRDPQKRAELLHVFLHHEVQAAELMAWVILRFGHEAPEAFLRGLHKIALDEVRHANLYQARIQHLGFTYGDFPVRDWLWARLRHVSSVSEFVSTMHIGIEGGNLDHTERFSKMFRKASDEESAKVIEQIHQDEISHVKFGAFWFNKLNGGFNFEAWEKELVPPWSPWLMRHLPIAKDARMAAGLDGDFCQKLETYVPA